MADKQIYPMISEKSWWQLRNQFKKTIPWMRLWWYIPPSPHIVQNSRELSVKGAQHRRFCGGLPLTGGTGCSISRRRGGGISSRAASFPMTGKGRGIGLNINGGLLMNFTNSPFERMMKEIPHKDIPAPNALKSRADVLTFGLKKGPVCKGFRQRFWWW